MIGLRTAALLLALTGSGATLVGQAGTPAPLAPVSKQELVKRMGLTPGQWHSAGRFIHIDIQPTKPGGGVDGKAFAEAQSKIGQIFQTDICLDTGVAANNDLALPGISIGQDCRLDLRANGSGHEFTANCGTTGVAETRVKVVGTHSTTTMKDMIETDFVSPGAGKKMNVKISMTSNRVGECP
ncbi:DUF3617 family protein [Sphingomonas sp. ERG5]|uniref:DUF3617 family protein n=1 Tax=Sphingomonas sp. ERG5 TaxID=1381597 RepID=UPI00054BD14B|nr:DUF3617 family protein [Sphingomonas sp. ERG5]